MFCDQSITSHTPHRVWSYFRSNICDKLHSLEYLYICMNSGICNQYRVKGHGWNNKTIFL
jgi:hypothetical protein